MRKAVGPPRKKSRSVGSEIVEALENAVVYAKGDTAKGRTHRILAPSRIKPAAVQRVP